MSTEVGAAPSKGLMIVAGEGYEGTVGYELGESFPHLEGGFSIPFSP